MIKFQFTTKQNFFINIFNKLLVLTLTVIISLSSIIYFYSTSELLSSIYKESANMFSQTNYNVEYLNKQLLSSITEISNSNSVSTLLNTSPYILDLNKSFEQIRTLMRSTPFIHSIYIYNSQLNTYYIIGKYSCVRTENFYDSGIIEILKNIKSYDLSNLIPRTIPNSAADTENVVDVFTYILPDTYVYTNSAPSSVIVNISSNEMFNYLLGKNKNNTNEYFFVIDHFGKVLTHINEPFLKDLSKEKYINTILNSKKQFNYFITSVNGTKSIITYSSLTSNNWFLISVKNYATTTKPLFTFKVFIILITLLILLLSVSFAFIISKKLYIPVENIFRKISKISDSSKP